MPSILPRLTGRLCAFVALAFALIAVVPATAVEPARIPIIAWAGPPANETTPGRYRELAEAGFTHNYSNFPNAEAMAAALDVARDAGVKQFISIPELAAMPEQVAERFKAHPALAGYYLRDEPSAADFPQLAAWMKRIQAVDSEHPCYINLFPNYANAGQLGTATYQEHLAKFVAEVPSPIISFDHYPVVGDRLRGEWYANLEMVRSAALGAKKPFWAFALAVAHDPYPIATLEHLRLQAFSNLAYGAQAIQYFTYWTVKSPHWNFHEAPISVDGKRTPVFDRVKQVNREIQSFAQVFHDARVLEVAHTGALPAGTRAFKPAPPIESITTGEGGAVVSMLQKGNGKFLAIVNRDLKRTLSLAVKFDGSTELAEVTKKGENKRVEAREVTRSLEAGDMIVLRWPR
jgi:hypothetical protein